MLGLEGEPAPPTTTYSAFIAEKTAPTVGLEPTFNRLPDGTHNHSAKGEA